MQEVDGAPRRTAPPPLSAFTGTSPRPRPQHVETRAGICVCRPDQASQGPTSHARTPTATAEEQSQAPPASSFATHTTSLSLPSSHHRACGARAAVAHRDVADATDTAIATVAVHHLRGTDGRPLSHTRSKTADDRPSPPAHRLPPQRHEHATRAGKGAHRVVAVHRMALHRLRHSSGARQGRDTWDRTPVAPLRPTDSTTPDAPLLRVARDPRDA